MRRQMIWSVTIATVVTWLVIGVGMWIRGVPQ